jgi:hypothetical protein
MISIRKPYNSPSIVFFGRLRDLTRGGSRGQKEVFSPYGIKSRKI